MYKQVPYKHSLKFGDTCLFITFEFLDSIDFIQ